MDHALVSAFKEPDLRTLPQHTMMTRIASIGLMIAALGLAACGRKGPLDLPPTAQAPAPAATSTTAATSSIPTALGQRTQPDDPSFDSAGNPIAGRADRKNFPLDALLN